MGSKGPRPIGSLQTDELLDLADQLECKLEQLDAMGAHLAAAHLDTAIARIRADAKTG